MRTSNPALATDTFQGFTYRLPGSESMTMQGTVYKTALLLICLLLSAGWTWLSFFRGGQDATLVAPWMMGGMIGGLVLGMVTIFKKEWAFITAPLYAICQGFFIGGLSSILEASYPGVALQAVALTFGTCAVMLFIYQTGLIRVTDSFKMGVAAATGGVMLFYLAALALSFFGIQIPGVFSNGVVGILFSLFVVGLAALNLVLDFDFIAKGAQASIPKYMEWYGAFALMVTLVWLYIELLNLLAKLRSR